MNSDSDLSLATIERCFSGATPAVLATADADDLPNVTYLSRVHPVDDHRIALSNQFMSKTSRNLAANPRANLLLIDPVTYDEYRLALVYERTERRGPVFERLRSDIDDLAALSGMQEVFRLRAADVFRVTDIATVGTRRPSSELPEGHPRPRDLDELADLVQSVARAADADIAIDVALADLDRRFGLRHTYLMLLDETGERLYTLASHGYDTGSLGAEIAVGDGHVGSVAARCEASHVGGLRQMAKYSRSIRRGYEADGVRAGHEPVPPGLALVDSRVVVPAMSRGQLIGVLVAETQELAAFGAADVHVLTVVATVLAGTIELERDDLAPSPARPADPIVTPGSTRQLHPPTPPTDACVVRFFAVDGSVFVGDDYVIKGVAGRVLWCLLGRHAATGRTEFTNRELRLDPSLDLPGFKDNLESRLLLLRRRLEERDTPFAIVRTGRGRFRLDVGSVVALQRGDEPNDPLASGAIVTPS